MPSFQKLIDFHLFGRHRLEKRPLLPLGSSLADAIQLYGEPMETGPSEDAPEITQYVFSAGPYHDAVALELDQEIQSITYWSAKVDPGRDLCYMLQSYQGDSGWHVMEEGYWYQRDDGKLRLWCSAIPALGIATVDFLQKRNALKTAHDVQRLARLEDMTWASNNAIFELQKQCIEKRGAGLRDLARRSDKIAVSPDGRYVFIVRRHRARDVEGGFMETNEPPEPGDGSSTQVINYFLDGNMWGKVVLPRNAHVETLRFEGELCHLHIRRTTRTPEESEPAAIGTPEPITLPVADPERELTFHGPPAFLPQLSSYEIGPMGDDKLWRQLQKFTVEQ